MPQMYHNPRLEAVIHNWPTGHYRTTATFRIETHPTRGQRATRITAHPLTGKANKPKVLTFAKRARIVDGDDGRTYILEDAGSHLSVRQSNMQYDHEIIWPEDPRYADLLALFQP